MKVNSKKIVLLVIILIMIFSLGTKVDATRQAISPPVVLVRDPLFPEGQHLIDERLYDI